MFLFDNCFLSIHIRVLCLASLPLPPQRKTYFLFVLQVHVPSSAPLVELPSYLLWCFFLPTYTLFVSCVPFSEPKRRGGAALQLHPDAKAADSQRGRRRGAGQHGSRPDRGKRISTDVHGTWHDPWVVSSELKI